MTNNNFDKNTVVSIITRTKNRPIFLERALQSVLNQSYANWQHVIVNDAGDENEIENLTAKYKDKYAGRLKLIHNPVSHGMEAASNIGIKNSDGAYIVIHDDDDTWEDNFLDKTVNYLEKNTKIGGVVSHANYVIEKCVNQEIETLDKYTFNNNLKNLSIFQILTEKNYPPPISFVFRRKGYEQTGAFNEDLLKYGDREFYLRFLTRFDIDVIPEYMANYHARPYDSGVSANSTLNNDSYKDNLYWENKVMNTLLRQDFEKNSMGLGFIANFVSTISPFLKKDKIQSTLKLCMNKKVALYGAGIVANELLENYKGEFASMNVIGIFDQDKNKQGRGFHGYKVFAPDAINKLKPEIILLTVASTSMVEPFIQKLIKKKNIKCEIIKIS